MKNAAEAKEKSKKIRNDRIVNDIPMHYVNGIEEMIDKAVSEGRFECDCSEVWTNEINNSKYVVNSIREWLKNLGYVAGANSRSNDDQLDIDILWH